MRITVQEREKIKAWAQCEIDVAKKYAEQGCQVLPTGKGSDIISFCPAEKPKFIEVKSGKARLSKLQKKTKNLVESAGMEYVVERCKA